jgi:hypothetical protein
LAISEISNLCLALGVTQDQLPIEIERVLVYHLRHFYDLGAMSTEALVVDLRHKLEDAQREVYRLKQLIYYEKEKK